MYAIDRRHKKILYSQEFKHHGIEGQKWGVITRNVGVNYVPIGKRGVSVKVVYGKDRKAVNEIYRTMDDDEKIFLAGEAGSPVVPKEYVSAREYGPKGRYVECVVLYQGKTPVSFCDISKSDDPGRYRLAIGTRNGPEYRGKGYASKALREAIKIFSKDQKMRELDYYAHKENTSSINLAKKFGFDTFEDNAYFVGMGLYK